VPLYQTSRADLHLRPENLHALKLAGLSDEHASLLCLSDLPAGPFPSSRFALVDHNILSPQFSSNTSSVVAIVDHHADEGRHTDADPREIAVPTGSCASLVANRIQAGANVSPPPSLAALLLATTVIDTQGLKPGGKAEAADRAAAAFLLPLSALLPASLDLVGNAERVHETPGLAELNEVLQTTKADVSGLGTRDILRRDYKEYTFSAVGGSLRVGLASVPISLLDWHTQIGEALGRDTEAWAAERGLDGLGVLTSFRDTDKLNKHGRPKHRREQLWLVRAGNLAPRLFAGLEANLELDLKPGSLAGITSFGGGWEARAYRQKNADASRKVTAPVVKAIIEEVTGDGSGQL
jgi:exopolyphosphatase